MLWHEMKSPDIDKLDRNLPVVIPLGSCEQHGQHLPLFVDTIQVQAIADKIEQIRSDRLLMLPTLWLGSSHHHRDFPGTISVTPSLYTQMMQNIAQCIIEAGFRRIFFLNGHGGNEIPLFQALSELIATNDEADASYLAASSWWQVAESGISPEIHGMCSPRITHACEYETSLLLYLRPELVDKQQIKEFTPLIEDPSWHSELGGQVKVFRRFHRLSLSGGMGRPNSASPEKGHSLLNAVTEQTVAFLDRFSEWPDLPVHRTNSDD